MVFLNLENVYLKAKRNGEVQLIKAQCQKLGFNLTISKYKTDSHWLLPRLQSEMVILTPGISE